MLSPSDFNSAVPQFTNGDYASNPINPQYIAEPDAVDYNRGAEPLQTLPAQWWNWFLNKFTGRFNKVNIYVKNIFNELTQLLSLVSVTPSGTEGSPTIGQLKDMFENKYPNYLALLMYPVGSIYWTGKAPDDGGDPNELFGGTWVQIKGKFVWAKGDSDTLNATGGAKTVTLTTDQIPSHTHTFTGSAVTSGGSSATNTGSESSHTHSYSHTHKYSHTHEYTPSGKIASTSGGTDNKTAGMSANSTGTIQAVHSYNGYYEPWQNATGCFSISGGNGGMAWNAETIGDIRNNDKLTINVAHTHTAYFTGTKSSTTSQSANTTTDQSETTTGSGSSHSHTMAHTHSVTASGTNSSTGGGQAHDNMPPYIVKYCWERTA